MISEAEELRKILAANIKKRRKKIGISQEKLAELTNLSAQTINDIEGRQMWVSDKTMVKLAKALDLDVYELLVPDESEFKIEALTNVLENIEKSRQIFKKGQDLLTLAANQTQNLKMG
jgi:transcriptional regulator with XRE-family HTH domain